MSWAQWDMLQEDCDISRMHWCSWWWSSICLYHHSWNFWEEILQVIINMQKKQVKLAQTHEWLWLNNHSNRVVYSTSCTEEASKIRCTTKIHLQKNPSDDRPEMQSFLSYKWESLLSNKAFQNVIWISPPSDTNYKFVNSEYRNKRLASLYGRSRGLCEIMEVSNLLIIQNPSDHSNSIRLTNHWSSMWKELHLENTRVMIYLESVKATAGWLSQDLAGDPKHIYKHKYDRKAHLAGDPKRKG